MARGDRLRRSCSAGAPWYKTRVLATGSTSARPPAASSHSPGDRLRGATSPLRYVRRQIGSLATVPATLTSLGSFPDAGTRTPGAPTKSDDRCRRPLALGPERERRIAPAGDRGEGLVSQLWTRRRARSSRRARSAVSNPARLGRLHRHRRRIGRTSS